MTCRVGSTRRVSSRKYDESETWSVRDRPLTEETASNDEGFLPYLKLLHEDTPQDVAETFYSLLDDHPDLELVDPPEDPSSLEVDRHVEFDFTCSVDWREFLRWWLEQYDRDLARRFDALTGLYSRSYWDRRLRPEFEGSGKAVTVVLADIDHFKNFNDTYGHAVGDRVLRAVGDVLQEVYEPPGTCVRYGGEELLVLDPGEPESVRSRAETFRREVQNDLFENQPEPVTVSQGISTPGEEDSTLTERIERADLALYASKNRGRNRVTEFAPYMRHRESLSVWGFYRYFWGSGLRFCFGPDSGTFFLYYDGTLKKYRWADDEARTVSLPDVAAGVGDLLFRNGNLYLLDGTGELWVGGSDGWTPAPPEDTPPLIGLLDAEEELLAAATNNQLYRLNSGGARRVKSLPERWERLLFLGEPMVVVDDQLRTLEDSPRFWDLPQPYVDFSTENEELVMSSKGGNLYVFDGSINHWKEMKLPDFLNHRVNVRNIERKGDSVLIHDANGRFFLTSRKNKSVPQRMSFGF